LKIFLSGIKNLSTLFFMEPRDNIPQNYGYPSLTPIANTPLPFSAVPLTSIPNTTSGSAIPMVSMLEPSAEEMSDLARQIAELLSPKVVLPTVPVVSSQNPGLYNVPSISSQYIPLSTTSSSLPIIGSALPSVSLPGLPQVSLPGLPQVSLPGLPQVSLPGLPQVSLPGLPQTGLNLPQVSLPGLPQAGLNLPQVSLPGLPQAGLNLPQVSLPGLPQAGSTLPQVSLPGLPQAGLNLPQVGATLPQVSLPSLPQVGAILPQVSLPTLPGLSQVSLFNIGFTPNISRLLEDNEIGDLRWNRPNPPRPVEITSSYRRIGCIGDGSCFFHAVSKGLSEIYQLTYQIGDTISEKDLRKFESAVNNTITFPSTLFTTPRTQNPEEIYTFIQPYGKSSFNSLMNRYRRHYVKMLRQDFAYQVLNDDRMKNLVRLRLYGSVLNRIDAILDYYQKIGQYYTREQVEAQAFQDVLNNLAQELLSGNSVQPDFMLLLSDYTNIDIYLLRDAQLTNTNARVPPFYGRSIHDSVHGPADLRPPNDIYLYEPNRPAIVLIAVDDVHYEIVARVDAPEGNEIARDIHTNLTQNEPIVRQLYEILVNWRYIV
jgi:hypothetical protein